MKAALALGFLLAGLLLPAELAQAQLIAPGKRVKPKKATVSVDYLAGLYGVTFCRDNGSVAFVRAGLSAMDAVGTMAHEQKHLEQHGRFPNCRAFEAYYRTPKGMLAIEAEAFHADWCAVLKMGADTVSRRALYIQILMARYVPGTPIYEVAQEFGKHGGCQE
jgi:hypothetical protein